MIHFVPKNKTRVMINLIYSFKLIVSNGGACQPAWPMPATRDSFGQTACAEFQADALDHGPNLHRTLHIAPLCPLLTGPVGNFETPCKFAKLLVLAEALPPFFSLLCAVILRDQGGGQPISFLITMLDCPCICIRCGIRTR